MIYLKAGQRPADGAFRVTDPYERCEPFRVADPHERRRDAAIKKK